MTIVPLRILIVGCGSIGRRHLDNLRKLGETDIILCDADEVRATGLAQLTRATAGTSLEAALECQPQLVMICTPTHLHVPHALRALSAGAHVFIEKPISHTLDDLDHLLDEAVAQRRHVMVGYNLRFHAHVRRLKELIDAGVIGRPILFRAEAGQYLPDWRPAVDYRSSYSVSAAMGGGVILDTSHEMDYLRWIGGEIDAVSCVAGTFSSLEMDAEDTALMTLRMASGAVATLHLDCFQRGYSRTCKVIGERGTLFWDFQRGIRHTLEDGSTIEVESRPVATNDMYLGLLAHVLNVARGLETPVISGLDGKRVLQIALAAKASVALRREIPLSQTIAIIQARMGSSRLPGKISMDVAGIPVLGHVIRRARRIRGVDQVIVATTTNAIDDETVRIAANYRTLVFRGSETDVLDRFYRAGMQFGAGVIVRLTADCPLLDPVVCSTVLDHFHRGNLDYVSNTVERTYPNGLDIEVCSFDALARAWRESSDPFDREHVTHYLLCNPNLFRLANVHESANYSHLRWTIDYRADLDFVREVYSRLPSSLHADSTMAEVMEVVRAANLTTAEEAR